MFEYPGNVEDVKYLYNGSLSFSRETVRQLSLGLYSVKMRQDLKEQGLLECGKGKRKNIWKKKDRKQIH